MAQRRHHYERAFEEYLRSRRIPYISVDEARKAILPDGASFSLRRPGPENAHHKAATLKSFDFVIYGEGVNLLADVKGRRMGTRGVARARHSATRGASRLESWVTADDVESLLTWQGLFGQGFEAALIFVYWCDEQPPDALFQEIFEYRGRWYALRAITAAAYRSAMKQRSARWRTVDVPTAAFERLSQPFAPPFRGSFAPGREVLALSDPSLSEDPGPHLPALQPYAPPLG